MAGLDGFTHPPPTKKWSGALREMLAVSVKLMSFLLGLYPSL
jgi:hypothetical protein